MAKLPAVKVGYLKTTEFSQLQGYLPTTKCYAIANIIHVV